MKFLHLSDLHVTDNESALENQMADHLCKWIKNRYSQGRKPAILITGDLVDNGEGVEYQKVQNLLYDLKNAGFQLIICPGNHDYGKNGIHYRDAARDLFFECIERDLLANTGNAIDMVSLYPKVTAFTPDKVVFFGLDSTEGKMDNVWNLHLLANGKVGKEQRRQLHDCLVQNEYKDYTKIVYMHSHPWELIPGHGLDDGPQLISEIKNKVDIICFGHYHTSNYWESKDNMMALNAGKSTQPASVNGKPCLSFREVAIDASGVSVGVVKVPLDVKLG